MMLKVISGSRFFITEGSSYYLAEEGKDIAIALQRFNRVQVIGKLFIDIVAKHALGYIVSIYLPDGTKQEAMVSELLIPGTIKITNWEALLDAGIFNLK